MDYEKFGICMTMIIMIGVLSFAGVSAGQIDLEELGIGSSNDVPKQYTSSTSTDIKSDGYYAYCYKMGIDC